MTTVCLKNLLDCSKLGDVSKEQRCLEKLDNWKRVFLLTLSFVVFSFLIGPNVQRSLPAKESVALVNQSKNTRIKSGISPALKLDKDKAAKFVLVLGLSANN